MLSPYIGRNARTAWEMENIAKKIQEMFRSYPLQTSVCSINWLRNTVKKYSPFDLALVDIQ